MIRTRLPKDRPTRAALALAFAVGVFQLVPLAVDAPSFSLPAADRIAAALRPSIAQPADLPSIGRGVSVASVGHLARLFDRAGYDLARVRDGSAPVPRLYLARLPSDLAGFEPLEDRKILFLQLVLPLMLRVNLEIELDRIRARYLTAQLVSGKGVSRRDEAWLVALAKRYKVIRAEGDIALLDRTARVRLMRRIDGFPPSLMLAQAIVESGWGTSRFARLGNALFGQWTWDESAGIVPIERDDGEGHAIRAFDNLLDSVRAYAHNLNTHPGYAAFRDARHQIQIARKNLDSLRLTAYLTAYSERRGAYIAELNTIIRQNTLNDFDRARLGRPIAVSDAMPFSAGCRIVSRTSATAPRHRPLCS